MALNPATKRMYDRRKAAGRCRRCENTHAPGRHLCEPCYAKRRRIENAKNAARKASGLCPRCGQPKALGRGYCDRCSALKAKSASEHGADLDTRLRLLRE